MKTLIMYDATPGGVDAIPSNAQAVAGYIDGLYVSFPALVRRFYPHAHCVSIGVWLGHLAEFTDVEPGNPVNTPALVRADFLHRRANGVWKPGFYANQGDMDSIVIPGLSGIPREEYRLILADWDGVATVPPGYEAKQFTNNSRNGREGLYDSSIVNIDTFFPAKPKRIIHLPKPKPPHVKIIAGVSAGGVATGLVALMHGLGVSLTPPEWTAIGVAVTGLAGYLKKSKP